MAWLWSSTPISSANAKPESQSQPQSQPPSPPPRSQPPPPAPAPTTTTLSQSDHPDAAFHAAYPHLAPSPSPSSSPLNPSNPSTFSHNSPSFPIDPSHPTHLSCRALFDSAFHCASFGGKFNDIYRYGTLRNCSEHWADWRFCMRLKVYSEGTRREMVRERYARKEEVVKRGKNSEDVWERRGVGEEVRGAF
ncbi:uncharacterized protein BDR25DRAFT_260362, partial [Lindgomyces ingoldianus]